MRDRRSLAAAPKKKAAQTSGDIFEATISPHALFTVFLVVVVAIDLTEHIIDEVFIR